MNRDLRNPLGTRDLDEIDTNIREHIFTCTKQIFKKRDAVQLDTPVIELFSTVQNLYGDEFNKFVYKLDDSNNDTLILRYDLTVPLARYVSMNGLKKLKRFQIGKVYRKDNPQINKGRYREFYQCDFDIVGDDNNTDIYDLELLDTVVELLDKLIGINTYKIQLNHRNIINNFCNKNNIHENQINFVLSCFDKLDKKSWTDIQNELYELSIDKKIINCMDEYIKNIQKYTNDYEILEYLLKCEYLDKNLYDKFNKLISIFKDLGIYNRFVFNPLLARGLDYYTGIIFEAVYLNKEIMNSTICAGGRYDNMIGSLSNNNIPAIGMSLGVERIATILEKTEKYISNKTIPHVYIATIHSNKINMIEERVKLCCKLRKLGLCVVMSHLENPKMRVQFDEVFERKIPFMVVIGETEVQNKIIKIKDIDKKIENSYKIEEGIKYLLDSIII
jgi:histidyl-tRNA synthetase